MINKKGALGEGVIMLYRFAIIIFIALVIFGLASVFYDYNINVRAIESAILTKKIADCLAPVGAADLSAIEAQKSAIFDYCKIRESSRYYSNVSIYDGNKKFINLEIGNSGLVWVSEIYAQEKAASSIKKYAPAGYSGIYEVVVIQGKEKVAGEMRIDSYVSHEIGEN